MHTNFIGKIMGFSFSKHAIVVYSRRVGKSP